MGGSTCGAAHQGRAVRFKVSFRPAGIDRSRQNMGLARWLASPLTALAGGVAQALAIADPWTGQPHGWLQVLSLAVLVAQLVQRTRREVSWSASTWARPEKTGTAWRRGLLLGWLFGLGWLAGSFWWLYISMHTYGGLPAALAVLAVLALAGALSLYYAAACALQVRYAPRERAARALLFAALWLLAELARGVWFTGFGWGGSGYAMSRALAATPVAGAASACWPRGWRAAWPCCPG
jgi:apolipoprotein N-acyltransferase